VGSNRHGYRGYIASRPVRGHSTPQHVQNLVIRDYAGRHGLEFKLSATEYAMPSCFMMLNALLDELPNLEGVICYSMFMLPGRPARRREIYVSVLDAGCALHAALEGIAIHGPEDIARVEDIFLVDQFAATAVPELADGLR
jgi:sporadic carbohydrate cluster protein (TIGR04323 family)